MTSSDNSTKAASTAYVTTAVAAVPSTTPGGSDTQIQYNNGGAFGGIDKLTWDDTNVIIASGTKLQFADTNRYIHQNGDHLWINNTETSGRLLMQAKTHTINYKDGNAATTLLPQGRLYLSPTYHQCLCLCL